MGDLGRRIKELRRKKGLSLRQLGKAAGVSSSYISQLERGEASNPGIEKLARVAQALGVDLDYLLGLSPAMSSEPVLRAAPPVGTDLSIKTPNKAKLEVIELLEEIVAEAAKLGELVSENAEKILLILSALRQWLEEEEGDA